jgi:hypothetical protein
VVEATDEVGVTDDVVVDGQGGGSEAIRIERGGPDLRSASVDRSAEGSVDVTISGSLPRKQLTELRTARLLVEHLNGAGAAWEPPVSCDDERRQTGAAEDGVDCVSCGPNGELRIQVTTPETQRWQELAKTGLVDHRGDSTEGLVEAIWASVQRKRHVSGRSKIVLALDATDSPAFAFRTVVAEFRASFGGAAAAIGYQSIWLVGPVADLVQRLDVES